MSFYCPICDRSFETERDHKDYEAYKLFSNPAFLSVYYAPQKPVVEAPVKGRKRSKKP